VVKFVKDNKSRSANPTSTLGSVISGCVLLHVGLARGISAMTSGVVVALRAWSVICGTVVQATKDFDFFYFVQQVRAPCLTLIPVFDSAVPAAMLKWIMSYCRKRLVREQSNVLRVWGIILLSS